MTIMDDKIRNEKLQHDINREVAKISALSSGKSDKYEFLTGEEILLIKEERWNKLSLHIFLQEKLLKKKPIKDQGNKQIKAIEDLGKHLVKTNEVIKNDFNINKDGIPLQQQKKYLITLLKKNILIFRISKKKIILII